MSTRSFISLVLIMLSVVPSAAQHSISFGPQIGFYKAKDAEQTNGMGGLSLRAKLSDRFGMEGSINFRKEKYFNGTVEVNSWPVMVTGLFYPAPVVYGALGAGWYNTNIRYHYPVESTAMTSETQQEFGWHFGGGMELPISSGMRLIGDLKYVFLNYNFTKFPGSNDVNSNFYVMTAGVLFSL